MVYRLAARMLSPGPEAEDATQEAFVQMHRAFEQYDLDRPLKPWLGRITYHVCLKRMAKQRRVELPVDPVSLVDLEDGHMRGPEAQAADRQVGALITEAMGRLSAQDRALVTMRYVDGLTDVEVGEAVGMNRNTVRTRLYRARATLRRALGPLLDGGDRT